jgi:cell division protein FtsL
MFKNNSFYVSILICIILLCISIVIVYKQVKTLEQKVDKNKKKIEYKKKLIISQ